MAKLLSVEEALKEILSDVSPLSEEMVALADCGGRVLADDLAALRTQPPFSASAMDGYALRSEDVTEKPFTLEMIGESAAGHCYIGQVSQGECVRIFTGAPLPEGTDTIAIQENVEAHDTSIKVLKAENKGRYVRATGLDFCQGDVLLEAGTTLDATSLSLAASMNHPELPVRTKPKVAIIASGDELKLPGEKTNIDEIISSNSFGVCEIAAKAGAQAQDLGIAKDSLSHLAQKLETAQDSDIVITLGGASVGDHDLVHQALLAQGVEMNFWKLAMRPGKPVMFGMGNHNGKVVRYIGLPGNPVSSLVGALILVVPLVKRMLGLPIKTPRLSAVLAKAVPQNDQREEYMRAKITIVDGVRHVSPFDNQDSSLLSLLSKADCLMVRPARAPAYMIGDSCEIIPL